MGDYEQVEERLEYERGRRREERETHIGRAEVGRRGVGDYE